jgi:hypothetical protein
MSRSATYGTAIVLVHLLVNVVHGLAHRELGIGLSPLGSAFVVVVILVLPLIAMALLWTIRRRVGLILLTLSMFGALLFGLYHHFVAAGPDHIHAQPSGGWGDAFLLTSYLLLISEALGTYVGLLFLSKKIELPHS